MTPLCELAKKYGTDKFPWYTPFYHLLLGQRNDICRVLEIGIGTPEAMKHVTGYKPGASLRMWRDYFSRAQVYGLDVDARVLFSEERIKTAQADQSDPAALYRAVWPFTSSDFDLIVDDGSHDPEHQVTTFNTLFPLVAEGGLYIIEDVNGPLPLNIPHPYQAVECRVAESPYAGRLIVVSK